MTHYICTGGCEGVSDNPGVCKAEDCPKHGMPLDKCECSDVEHKEAESKEKSVDKS